MLGILGGTFNPIHYGHLRTALDVQQALGLEQIRLIPLRSPPHRPPPAAAPGQRLTMVQAAIRGTPVFRVDERELNRSGKSYTLDTLRSLREELSTETALCLLIGSDALRGFPDWHRSAEILDLAHLVVMQRPGEGRPNIHPERVTVDRRILCTRPGGHIFYPQVTQLEISSTHIRNLLKAGLDPRFLLPDPVLSIIRRERLYL
jgi:nicotinate-nucleotide adenylyltransferase